MQAKHELEISCGNLTWRRRAPETRREAFNPLSQSGVALRLPPRSKWLRQASILLWATAAYAPGFQLRTIRTCWGV